MEFVDEDGAPVAVHSLEEIKEPIAPPSSGNPATDHNSKLTQKKHGKGKGRHVNRYIENKLHRRQKYTKSCRTIKGKVCFFAVVAYCHNLTNPQLLVISFVQLLKITKSKPCLTE